MLSPMSSTKFKAIKPKPTDYEDEEPPRGSRISPDLQILKGEVGPDWCCVCGSDQARI